MSSAWPAGPRILQPPWPAPPLALFSDVPAYVLRLRLERRNASPNDSAAVYGDTDLSSRPQPAPRRPPPVGRAAGPKSVRGRGCPKSVLSCPSITLFLHHRR